MVMSAVLAGIIKECTELTAPLTTLFVYESVTGTMGPGQTTELAMMAFEIQSWSCPIAILPYVAELPCDLKWSQISW